VLICFFGHQKFLGENKIYALTPLFPLFCLFTGLRSLLLSYDAKIVPLRTISVRIVTFSMFP
jgi:hypothetical protein